MTLGCRLLSVLIAVLFAHNATADPAALRALAHDAYQWRDAEYPVATSGAGDHRFDQRLTDYTMAAGAQTPSARERAARAGRRDEHRRLEQG